MKREYASNFMASGLYRLAKTYIERNKKVRTDLCVKCGICVRACPYNAINMNEYPTFDETKCEGCFACYNHCPKKAIYTKLFKQYANYPRPLSEVVKKLSVKNDK